MNSLPERQQQRVSQRVRSRPVRRVVSPGQSLSVHPFAEKWRRSDDHRKNLRHDLQQNGQLQPGATLRTRDGHLQILDGCTRKQELDRLSKPFFVDEYTEDMLIDADGNPITPEQFILLRNLTAQCVRRTNDTERAIYAAMAAGPIERAAAQRRNAGRKAAHKEKGTTTEILARIAKVKPARIEAAICVVKSNLTRLQQLVLNGLMPVNEAKKVARHFAHEKNPAIRASFEKAAELVDDKQAVARLKAIIAQQYRDASGYHIPTKLRPLFAAVPSIKKHARAMEVAAQCLRELQRDFDFAPSIKCTELEHLASDLLEYAPIEVCHCGGKNQDCANCGGRGYVSRRR